MDEYHLVNSFGLDFYMPALLYVDTIIGLHANTVHRCPWTILMTKIVSSGQSAEHGWPKYTLGLKVLLM